MKTKFNMSALALLMSVTFYSMSAHAESSNSVLEQNVQKSLVSNMGDSAKDVTVSSDNGSITLHGWVQNTQDESKARFLASRVEGVSNAYSTIHTFSTNHN